MAVMLLTQKDESTIKVYYSETVPELNRFSSPGPHDSPRARADLLKG